MNDTGMEDLMQQDPWAEYYFTITEDGEVITEIDISIGWPVDLFRT